MKIKLTEAARAIIKDEEKYQARIERDFQTMKPWLPKQCDRILDIGCGLGGVDVLVAKYVKAKHVGLLDGDGSAARKMGFVPTTEAWFNVAKAVDLVRLNLPERVGVDGFSKIDLDKTKFRVGLVISLKSWGHHYAVSAYLDFVKASLEPGGVVIMDIRSNGAGGAQQMMAAGFRLEAVCHETIKAQRCVFTRPT